MNRVFVTSLLAVRGGISMWFWRFGDPVLRHILYLNPVKTGSLGILSDFMWLTPRHPTVWSKKKTTSINSPCICSGDKGTSFLIFWFSQWKNLGIMSDRSFHVASSLWFHLPILNAWQEYEIHYHYLDLIKAEEASQLTNWFQGGG